MGAEEQRVGDDVRAPAESGGDASHASAGSFEQGPVFPAAPPTTPGRVGTSEGKMWPNVIGIISISLGALAILGGIVNALSQLVMSGVSSMGTPASTANSSSGAKGPDVGAMMKAMAEWAPLLAVMNILMSLVAAALLVGGIGMVRRKAWGRTWHVWWAWVKIVTAVGMAAATALMQRAQFASMSNSGSSPPGLAAMGSVMMAVTGIFLLFFYWAYPTVILIWMHRRSIREQIARWE